jgi:hypothetical protein
MINYTQVLENLGATLADIDTHKLDINSAERVIATLVETLQNMITLNLSEQKAPSVLPKDPKESNQLKVTRDQLSDVVAQIHDFLLLPHISQSLGEVTLIEKNTLEDLVLHHTEIDARLQRAEDTLGFKTRFLTDLENRCREMIEQNSLRDIDEFIRYSQAQSLMWQHCLKDLASHIRQGANELNRRLPTNLFR